MIIDEKVTFTSEGVWVCLYDGFYLWSPLISSPHFSQFLHRFCVNWAFCISFLCLLKSFPCYFLMFESMIILISTVSASLNVLGFFKILLTHILVATFLMCFVIFECELMCLGTICEGNFWSPYLKYVPPEIYIGFWGCYQPKPIQCFY